MSVIAAREVPSWSGHAPAGGRSVLATVKRHRALILAFALLFPVAFYMVLMGLLVVRFGHLPNYVTSYDWLGNVWRIIAGTGSISDMVKISMDEWLLEFGYRYYAYGRGVSEWSLLIIPHKVVIVMAIGALIGFNFALIADQAPAATFLRQQFRSIRCGLMTSVGALGAGLTSITLYWVICHSGPTWVVSLAILGIDVSRAFAIEPLGATLSLAGAALLVASALLTIYENRAASNFGQVNAKQVNAETAKIKEAAPC
jgi:hypothetical protein